MSAKPDAVLIAGSGTPAALPQKSLKERGYKGKIYQTHGVANADFLRVGGKDVEGTFLPAGPVLVADSCPRRNPVKKSALAYSRLRGRVRQGLGLDLRRARLGRRPADGRAVPVALKKAQPGTPEFRAALRDALETGQGAAGCARRLQHDGERPPGPRPARPRDGQDR